jgi:hypothetical protein
MTKVALMCSFSASSGSTQSAPVTELFDANTERMYVRSSLFLSYI